MKKRTVYIYGLVDPRTNEVRYVGKTVDLQSRRLNHINYAKKGQKNYKSNWIRKLLRKGLEPSIRVLEETTEDTWQEAEKKWIAKLLKQGIALTNRTRGGDGFTGRHTKEARQKIAEASRKREKSEEERRKSSLRMKGHQINKPGIPLSESHRKKIGDANRGPKNGMYGKPSPTRGRKQSEEARKKNSESHKGQIAWNKGIPLTEEHKKNLRKAWKTRPPMSDETRRKLSKSLKGRPAPNKGVPHTEEHKRKIREAWARRKAKKNE